MTPYSEYLIHVASENADNSMAIDPPTFADPVAFVREILQDLDNAIQAGTATTRFGIELMMDELFANEDLSPLLDAPENGQHDIGSALLSQSTNLFQNYWTHIICPAWNQHADIRSARLASG
jgi:hypothetical protein